MKDYPSEAVQNYIESKKKWWWIGYAIIPLLIGIKVLLVAFCLNFIKLFDLRIRENQLQGFLGLTLVAEFTFVIAGFYKFINFYWFETNYDLRDLQTYYPLSLLNFKDVISIEKWLAYPLQLSNIFRNIILGYFSLWNMGVCR